MVSMAGSSLILWYRSVWFSAWPEMISGVVHLRQVHAGRQAQPAVQAAHPFGIALRQVVVDGDDVHALAGQRVQIGRQGRHQRLALARAHFRDLAVVQDHAADHLDVEVAHLEHAPGCLAAHRERFRQQVVERLAVRDAILEFRRLGLEFSVGQLFDLRLERVNLAHGFLILLEQPLVAATENLGQ
jgi:hypothetical protein